MRLLSIENTGNDHVDTRVASRIGISVRYRSVFYRYVVNRYWTKTRLKTSVPQQIAFANSSRVPRTSERGTRGIHERIISDVPISRTPQKTTLSRCIDTPKPAKEFTHKPAKEFTHKPADKITHEPVDELPSPSLLLARPRPRNNQSTTTPSCQHCLYVRLELGAPILEALKVLIILRIFASIVD